MRLTFEEVRLEVDLEQVAGKTLDRVVEWEDVDTLAILDVQARVDVDNIAELDSKVVAGDLVHLDFALFHGVGAQANENSIVPPLAAIRSVRDKPIGEAEKQTHRTMMVSPRKSWRASIVAGFKVATKIL